MKADWKKVKLGEVCLKIGSGATPNGGSRVYIDSGVSFIRSQNVYNLNFEYNGLTYITDGAAKKLSGVTIEKDDILLNITGDSVARTCIVPTNVLPARVNQHVSIIRLKKNTITPKFLNYYLASPYMQSIMLGLAVGKGASRNAITKTMIENFEVPCPPLETQQKIASILSAYDDLIENNRKQIKLLEEAAQRLYKEWFVDLRFPGYENVAIVDGVPEGWRIGTLGEIGEFKRGKTITRDTTIKGDIPVVAGGLEPAYYHNESNTESPVITVSGSGANAGFTRMYNEKIWASDCSFLDFSKCKVLNFIYCILKSSSAIVDNLQKGAAQPHVYAKDINALKILIPNNDLIEKFEYIINTYFFKIKNCQLEIKNAQQARDKLLPRLMSGEMEV